MKRRKECHAPNAKKRKGVRNLFPSLNLLICARSRRNVLQTSYCRYYTSGQANGYQHGLHHVFNAQSYARLTAALGTNLANLTDAQVAPYADNAFQYDSPTPLHHSVNRPGTATPAARSVATPARERPQRRTSRCKSLPSLHQDARRCIKGGWGLCNAGAVF